MTRRALGKGLEALIPAGENQTEKIVNLAIERISPNRFQPRKDFDRGKLNDLVSSLREKGVIQPVLVRRAGENYELISGERRLEASKMAGMKTIPAIVRKVDEREMLEICLIENIQRDDINAMEEASGYKRLVDDFGLTQEGIASVVGKDRATITNTLRLLKLPEEVQDELAKGRISRGHAVALLGLLDKGSQIALCQRIVKDKLNVRQAEVLVQRALAKPARRHKPAKSQALVSIEERLQRYFGNKVEIRKRKAGGKIEIEFYSEEDLTRLLELLRPLRNTN